MDDRMYIRRRYELLAGVMDERSRRLLLGAEAECIGYGGVSEVSRQTGVSRRTISEGIKDLPALQEYRWGAYAGRARVARAR